MILKIYAIYDKKAQAFAQPFYMHNKAEALRALDDITNNPQSPISKHPDDYQIFEIGEWNDLSALITQTSKPVFLEEAIAFVKKENKNG